MNMKPKGLKFAVSVVALFISLIAVSQSEGGYGEGGMCNLYARALSGNKTAVDSLKRIADTTDIGRAQQLYGVYLLTVGGKDNEAAEYFIKGAGNGSVRCAELYATCLGRDSSPLFDENKYKEWISQWKTNNEKRAELGDVNAMYSLGRALAGYMYWLTGEPDTDENRSKGCEYLLRAAIKGNANAKYFYAVFNDKLSEKESEAWIKSASDDGFIDAKAWLAESALDEGDYETAISFADEVISEWKEYAHIIGNNQHCSIVEMRTLASFLLLDNRFSLIGFGPIKDDKTTFYFSRDGVIMACATFRGKAGLLKLDSNGNRINHDDIPFVYDYILPCKHEFLAFRDCDEFFLLSPYKFRLPWTEYEIRVVGINGNETTFSMWSSVVPVVPYPADFIFDGPDN